MSRLEIFEIERFAIHDGPGIRTAVFLQGCPLRCEWCANPESQTTGRHLMHSTDKCTGCGRCVAACSQKAVEIRAGKAFTDRGRCNSCGKCAEECPNAAIKISGRTISSEELMELVMRDAGYYKASGGGVTLSGGEALLQFTQLIPFLLKCNENDISVAVETCGHVTVDTIRLAEKYADLFLFDIKTLDKERFHKFTCGNLDMVLRSFAYLAGNAPQKVIVRMPVIPGFNEKEILKIMRYAVKNNIREMHLLPYHTLGIAKYRQLGMEYMYPVTEGLAQDTLSDYIAIGKELGILVRIGG